MSHVEHRPFYRYIHTHNIYCVCIYMKDYTHTRTHRSERKCVPSLLSISRPNGVCRMSFGIISYMCTVYILHALLLYRPTSAAQKSIQKVIASLYMYLFICTVPVYKYIEERRRRERYIYNGNKYYLLLLLLGSYIYKEVICVC